MQTKVKAMLKSELAQAAGVPARTFGRWIATDQDKLKRMGVNKRTKLLSPKAVKYICKKYDIDI